ncbi:winged helix-turn-helix domain-containing protein [Ornithinimicrobium faecis]|uniref:Winged helix-turn-helix domain-containing protein n=1 Tax=Ornithinimicrobium faecis TaxID=2934158 RepID=A0ABY4YTK0_9MICO|nr:MULTISPECIES: winged helix-turn-helix domain-containing protein [unclassified Ornithinimicrobium]USQ79580.1 winged helix-turn-helix domain-containing protein [Ornithinimicrobium sp. HY1793]
MTQTAATEPRHDLQASRSAPLVVLVAPTVQERNALLSQLDPTASVLVVPSVEVAQSLMGSRQAPPVGVKPRSVPAGERPAAPGVRIHEDRRAVRFGSVEVTLTPLEFSLLRRLINEPGRVWRFDEIVREVWGTDHLGDASQVHAVVKRLRAKLARKGAPVVIEAVRGVGFRAVRPEARTA